MSDQNHRNFLQFLDDAIDSLIKCCSCIKTNDEIKIKIRIDQSGVVQQILIKYPDTNRYYNYDDNEYESNNVKMILQTWFMKDGNDYLTKDRLYQDLKYYYGKDPAWFELNVEWIKFSGSEYLKICGYKNFKI